ncbi:hypothetical protein CMV_012839 [Castanea mollissima]|uniref:Uncharacterized protein n=1 Tax=Castanea mollissima TaxID=60419 RepID=A0A8J4R8W8_9ROSI|nr:hypothetical protein CMV_012839 [Castanea mollissima]
MTKPGSSEPSHQEDGFSKLFFVCLIILFLSSTTPTILRVFPQGKVEGGVVPAIFRDRPADYHITSNCTVRCSSLIPFVRQLKVQPYSLVGCQGK